MNLKINIIKSIILAAGISLIFSGCPVNRDSRQTDEAYYKEVKDWKTMRIERLKSKTGWLNVSGLYWLKQGTNNFGSDSSNHIVFPSEAPAFFGTLILSDDSVTLIADPSALITIKGLPVHELGLRNDMSGEPDLLESGRFAWFIIKRGARYGVRLRDYQNPRIRMLDSIPSYPLSMRWKIIADYIPFDTSEIIRVNTVTGDQESYICPGKLIFRAGRKKYELKPFLQEDGFFIIFGDRTNGTDTYGSGRFMYTGKPDQKNKVILDFNRAYNPPCAFTPYATCPMPPIENLLDIPVEAGEKMVHIE